MTIRLHGTAGQALGFALAPGLRIELTGFANDMVGEALSGGEIVVRLPREMSAAARAGASAIGNAACYGATAGRLFVEGRAGQRLGVRNSAATIVTMGAGKYAFEYMTGGLGVVLGPIGPVIGSGMTGGALWLLDNDDFVERRLHAESVRMAEPAPGDLDVIKQLVIELSEKTGSERAAELVADWPHTSARLRKVVPREGTA